MSKSALENRLKWLMQALILSGTLNIGFLATLIYSVLREKEAVLPVAARAQRAHDEKKENICSNEKVLKAYSLLPYAELLHRLENREPGEDGYLRRDLALACLVAFHHFNLERALGGLEVQKREIQFTNIQGTEKIPLTIFPGLADYQYEAILHYARTEKWPFTTQGLFYELQRSSFPRDSSLLEAFYLTPEFHTLSILFARTGVKLERETLVEMVVKGEWSLLSRLTDELKKTADFSLEKCRPLLLSYFEQKSPIAAKLLLVIDQEFVAKRLSDPQLLLLFDLLPPQTPFLEAIAKEIITSPRSDALWKRAATHLYQKTGELLPEPYDHQAVLSRFFPSMQQKGPEPTKPESTKDVSKQTPPGKRTHLVQPGENLWKISRKYRVSTEALIRLNRLESEKLRPGKTLHIPD